MPDSLKFIDLFSGAGGMSAGFELLSQYHYKSIWANDFNRFASDTYNANFDGVCTPGDIVDLLEDPKTVIPRAHLVIGGPPCQGFSLLNKKRDNDPRKKLWIPFMEVVDRSQASMFVMENVPQLLGSLEFEEIHQRARLKGFKVWSGLLVAADYGVPQTRKRAFIIGSKTGNPHICFPPLKTNFNPDKRPDQLSFAKGAYSMNAKPWRTVRDAIGDLPEPAGREIRENEPQTIRLHFGRSPTPKSIARYKAIPNEGMNRFDLQRAAPEITPQCWINKLSGGTDLFGCLWWDRPAFTIRYEYFSGGTAARDYVSSEEPEYTPAAAE